jgi:rod shape-determining protein MreD
MKYWVVAAILLFNFIVQSAILPFLRIAGIQPDTLMVLVTCFGLLGGTGYGTFTGLAGGLLQDILYGSPVGLNGLHYMVIGFLTGLLYERIFTGRFIIPTFIVFCASLLRGLMMLGYLYFTRAPISLDFGFTLVILPEALYTAVFMPIAFYLMSLLFQYRFMKKKWQFRRR